MIISIFLILLASGFLLPLVFCRSEGKAVSFALLLVLLALFGWFCGCWADGENELFVIHWLRYKDLHVDVNLSSVPENYRLIFPVFAVSVSAALIAVFGSEENSGPRLVGSIFLNLAALMLLICSDNLIQLAVSSAMAGVTGFYLVNDLEARSRCSYYNLLADMGLFTVFAVIYGHLGNLDLAELERFEQDGAHRDLVAVLLLLSVFLKSGLFPFHNQLVGLSAVSFNRLNVVSWVSAPLSGVIILSKTLPLLSVSEYSVPLLQIFAVLTMVWAFAAGLVIDNIKERTVYLNLMIYAYIYALISLNDFDADYRLPSFVFAGYLLSSVFYMVFVASSNELYVSKMGSFFRSLKFTFALSLAVFVLFFRIVLSGMEPLNQLWSMALLAFSVMFGAHFFHQAYFGEPNADERVAALLKNPSWYVWLPLLAIMILQTASGDGWHWSVAYAASALLLCAFADPFCRLERLSEYEALQDEDYFEKAFDLLLLTPIRIFGRILWLLVDFILIERTIINSLNDGTAFLVRTASKLNASAVWSGVVLSLAGLVAMVLYFYVRG